MKNIISLISLAVVLLFSINTIAQINRADTRKSKAYNANYQRVSVGGTHTLEIRNGNLWAYGSNGFGQLGNGTLTQTSTPVQIGSDNNWVTISAGFQHSLGLKSDGTLWAWGWNGYGQLGNGTTTNSLIPIQIGTDNNWISIIAGEYYTLGIKSDGTLWAWGYNSNGQLGDGTVVNKTVPVQIGIDNKWRSISAGELHTIGLKSDGTLWAWGWNGFGQIGDGTTIERTNPVQVGSDTKWASIEAGDHHSIGIKSDGTLWAWGWNNNGQLGDGTLINKSSPLQIGIENTWVNATAGFADSHGLKSDGTLWSWGFNSSGQLGQGTVSTQIPNPTQIGTGNNWTIVSSGFDHTVGLKSDGTFWVWGVNTSGQLGIGNTINKISPFQTSFTQNVWLTVSAGSSHTLGLKSDGTIWAWGLNSSGQLGDGTTIAKTAAIQVGTDNKWVSISAGGNHSLGLKSDGTLWAWGANNFGQLGDGTGVGKLAPIQIGTATDWISISAGGLHSLALKSNGTLWGFGYNWYGQLGDGTLGWSLNIVQAGTDTKWVAIATGDAHSLAMKADGTLWSCGYSIQGQLGLGNPLNQPYGFAQVGTDNKWTSISAGGLHSLALKSNGTLWTWGDNTRSQLGDGTVTQRNSPVQIGVDNLWTSLDGGSLHSIGLKSNGTFWTWGSNSNGQQGNSTPADQSTPLQMGGLNTWVNVITGYNHTVALKSDRMQFCAAGSNLNGQLGDGTTIDKNTFVCSSNAAGCSTPPAPTNTTAGSNLTICSGNPTTLLASGSGTVSWFSSPTGGTALIVGSTFTTPNLATTTTYYAENFTCTASATRTAITVTVNAIPSVTASSLVNRCGTGSVNLSAIASGGTLNWYSVASGGTILGTGSPFTTPVISSTTVFYVDATLNGCTSARTAVTVNIISLPTANAGADQTVYIPNCATLTGNAVGIFHGYTYNWTPGGPGQSISVCPSSSGTYNYTLTVTNEYDCISTDVVTITALDCGYQSPSQQILCSTSTFCVPVNAITAVPSGIIGMDLCMRYNPAVMNPTGLATLGNVVATNPTEADYFISTVNLSPTLAELNMAIYYNGTGAPSQFSGTGNITCIEFNLTPGTAPTSASYSICGIDEDFSLSVNSACTPPASAITVVSDLMLTGTVQYRNSGVVLASTAGNIPTQIVATNNVCVPYGPQVVTDASGVFNLNVAGSPNAPNYKINRDIAGTTNVMDVINAADRLAALRIATKNVTFIPNVYEIIAADVNLDGLVRANDATMIAQRTILQLNEFPQIWNYSGNPPVSNGSPSLDWVFFDDSQLNPTPNPAFLIDPAYPNTSSFGFTRDAVPNTNNNCLQTPYNINGGCVLTPDVNLHAILLGDVVSSWTSAVANLKSEDPNKSVIYDLANAIRQNENLRIPVLVKSDENVDAIDFTIDYNEKSIAIVQVTKSLNNEANSIDFDWNNYNSEQLLFTSFTTNPILKGTSNTLFYIEIKADNMATLDEDFGNRIVSYVNGKEALTLVTASVLSIEEGTKDELNGINIYPNPSSGRFTLYLPINTEPSTITILDMAGRKVYSALTSESEYEIKLNNASKGSYVIQISSAESVIYKKIIIE